MPQVIAKCGNRCDACPLFVENFDSIGPEEINARLYQYHQAGTGTPPKYWRACDGCLSDGYIAREKCPIRECVIRRNIETCADCEDLFCGLLEADMKIIESAVTRYAHVMPQADYDRYLKPFLIRKTLSQIRFERRSALKPAKRDDHSL